MRYFTAGESHGQCLTAIIEGVPAGLKISESQINNDLARRQSGYGRGGRQRIEQDTVKVTAGLRFGVTTGSPVALEVENKDWRNWKETLKPFGVLPRDVQRQTRPRPGHADLVGVLKTDSDDCRTVSERASARETAARVAASGIAREFLVNLGVEVYSYVTSVGRAALVEKDPMMAAASYTPAEIEMSEFRCPDPTVSLAMHDEVRSAHIKGDSVGGTFRVVARGLLPGVGGYASAQDRLTSQLGAALFSIPAVKGVEFGLGFEGSRRLGSQFHDAIALDKKAGFVRAGNNAGGLEGGMTTGMPLVITVAMKPIPTLQNPLASIDIETLEPVEAQAQRSDVCAVPACAVVAEGEVAMVLANAYLTKFGCDSMGDIRSAVAAYKRRLSTMAR